MSHELPIDIHYNKLQDWLLSRRHCKQDWSNHVLAIREEINRAIQDMPPIESITKLLQGTYINYFHCKAIVSILKQTEGSRTLFGSYSSQRLKDWIAIIKAYEKENIYLAEGAQLLSRYVNFELPSLKRQLTKASQALQEYSTKQDDYARHSRETAEKYRAACKELNIEGKHLKKEVISLLDKLPLFFDEVLKDVRSFDNEINLYSEFRSYLSSGTVKKEICTPMLRYLYDKGNTTVYEWKHGKVPESIMRDSVDYGIEDEPTTQTDEIDWGNLDVEITEGITVDTEGQIDWGIEDVGSAKASDPITAAGDAVATTARGEEALSLLESLHCRNLLLDELHELEAFFVQRLVELKQSSSNSFMDSLVFQAAPQSILVTADDISVMLSNVRALINKFARPNIKELFLICSFPKHVDKMVEKLKRMMGDSEKMQAQSKVMELRQEEKKVEMADVEPKLDNLKQKTEILKKHMEEEISQRYKGRKVNIMGQINSI